MTTAMTAEAGPDPALALLDCDNCGGRAWLRAGEDCPRCGSPPRAAWAFDTD